MGIATKIDITPADLKTLQALLQRHIPQTTVWAFGSRVKFTNKPSSDLDLVAFTTKEQNTQVSLLKDAIEEAMLPYRVDLLCWHEIPENFKKNIEQQYVVVQQTNTNKKSLPKGWKTYKLGEIAELRKEQIIPNGKEQPYIGLEHIEQQSLRLNGFGSSNSVISNKFKFYSGDILYGKLRPYFRKVYKPKFEGVCSTDIYVIKNKKNVEKNFLYYLIATEEFTNIANSGSSGTRMPRADWKQLEKSEWAIPDLPTQTAIAQILTSLDDKIELNLQMNQTLEAMAQAIFKEWFVDFNFPGFDGKLLDGLPKGWKKGSIYELIDVTYGYPFKSNLFNSEKKGKGLIRIRDLKNNYCGFFTEEKAQEKYLINTGDVIAGMDAEFIPSIWLGEQSWLNQRLCKFSPINSNVSKLFIYHTVQPLLERLQYGKVGTTVIHLSKSDIDRYEILIPSADILVKYKAVSQNIHAKIIVNQSQNQTLTQIRDTLLPKLMSGKIEIKA